MLVRESLLMLVRESFLEPPHPRARTAGSEVNRSETEILTTQKNLKYFMDVLGKWIDRAAQRRSLDKPILDLNSSVSETYGRRERSR